MHGEQSSADNISTLISRVAVKVITITLLIFVCYAALNTGFRSGYTIFCADSVDEAPGNDVQVEITEGEGIDELAESLLDGGVILNKYAFMIQARLYKLELYPESYKLNTSMSVREMIKSLQESAESYKENAAAETAASDDGVIGGGDEGADADGLTAAEGTADAHTDAGSSDSSDTETDGGSEGSINQDNTVYDGTGSEGE